MVRAKMAAACLAAISAFSLGTALLAQQHARGPRQSRQQQVTGEKQGTVTVTMVYAINDITPIITIQDQGRTVRVANTAQVDALMELITATVAPGSWEGHDEHGKAVPTSSGQTPKRVGSILPFMLNNTLIVRHTGEVQLQVAERLSQVRRVAMRSEAAPPAHPDTPVPGWEQRLREIEGKLNQILKTLETAGSSRQPPRT